MDHFAMHRNAFASCDEMRASFGAATDRKPPVFCPKPRRVAPLAVPVGSLWWHSSNQVDICDREDVSELLDFFDAKDGETQMASSPPFFCGSPPSRVSNPVIQDKRFGEDRPLAAIPAPNLPLIQASPSQLSPRKGCVRAKFSLTPATVRIEGFDCLNRDRPGCSSITAVA